MTRAFLGLGTNLGDRQAELRRAVATLSDDGDLVAVSSLYETSPVGGPPQGDFLNLVVELDSSATPDELLERCRQLEIQAERVRTVRFGPRSLDADVLWMDGITRSTEELTIPHPRMWERRFVLAPLRELAPDLVSEEAERAAGGDVVRMGTL
jgi:2-amino-4-hydroxy-6-hydroxymethyldihydropteridine diphosphokinase